MLNGSFFYKHTNFLSGCCQRLTVRRHCAGKKEDYRSKSDCQVVSQEDAGQADGRRGRRIRRRRRRRPRAIVSGEETRTVSRYFHCGRISPMVPIKFQSESPSFKEN